MLQFTAFLTFISFFILISPQSGEAIVMTEPNVENFPDITLTGTNQDVAYAPVGTLSLFDALIQTSWDVTVEATPFTQVGGAGLTLPIGSLELARPTPGRNDYEELIQGGPWTIDEGIPVTILSYDKLLSLTIIENLTFDFGPKGLELSLDPGIKVIDENNNPTQYQSVITWTLHTGP